MGYGSNGTILRVDLTSGTTAVETFDEAFYRRYPGGKALAGYIMLNEIPMHTDPFSPENVMVFANGLLTGAPVELAEAEVAVGGERAHAELAGERRLARDDPRRGGCAEDERLPGEPQPPPLEVGDGQLDPGSRDPRGAGRASRERVRTHPPESNAW